MRLVVLVVSFFKRSMKMVPSLPTYLHTLMRLVVVVVSFFKRSMTISKNIGRSTGEMTL